MLFFLFLFFFFLGVIVVIMVITTMMVKDGSGIREDVVLEKVADYFLRGRMVRVVREPFKGLVGGHKDGVVVLVVAVGIVEQLLDIVVLVDDLGEALAILGLFDQFVDGLAGIARGVVAMMAMVMVMVSVTVVIVMLVIPVESSFKLLGDVFLD